MSYQKRVSESAMSKRSSQRSIATKAVQRPNSPLKLTVRPRFFRRPSRLPRLEICTASRHLHRHYRMRRKRRAARRWPPSGGPQFNVRTLGGAEKVAAVGGNYSEMTSSVVLRNVFG